MKLLNKIALATITTAFAAPMAFAAGSENNTMTNVATIVDACDIVAVGIDFGIQAGTIQNTILGVAANTAAGALISGNSAHPDAAADGGANDVLSLNTPVAALNTALNAALDGVVGTLPGVFVACTAIPTGLSVAGADGTANLDLTTAGALTPNTDFDSELTPSTNGASGATGSIDYGISFTGVVAAVDLAIDGAPSLFTGVYTAVGSIPAASNTEVITAGYYTDVVTATLTF